jgi:DNA-binding NarL/FixJ family response regulator
MKILVLDDHAAIRETIKRFVFEINPTADVIEHGCVHSALESKEHFDFAICDLELDKGCNTVVINRLTSDLTPVMIYSTHVNKVLTDTLNSKVIFSYVSKMSSISALQNGIEALLTGGNFTCPIVNATMKSNNDYLVTDKLVLTQAQKRLLAMINKGFTREETAEKLKNSITTVNNHIARARVVNECRSLHELLRRYRFWDYD